MSKENATPEQEAQQKLPTMQELAERMNHEFSLIRVRAAMIELKKGKFDMIQQILSSDVEISDEKVEEMKAELINLSESVLAILT